MRSRYLLALASLALAAPLSTASAQTATDAATPYCLSDWQCGQVRAPLGFYVRELAEGGRYVTLEDGSVWEIEISDRATTAAWQPEDFVGVRWIAAPRGDFEYLLSRVGQSEQRAAARLTGDRVPAPPEY